MLCVNDLYKYLCKSPHAWIKFKIFTFLNPIPQAPKWRLTQPVQMSSAQFWLIFLHECFQLLAPIWLSPLPSPSLSLQMNTSFCVLSPNTITKVMLWHLQSCPILTHANLLHPKSTVIPASLEKSVIKKISKDLCLALSLAFPGQKLPVTLTNWIFDSGNKAWRTRHYRVLA